VEHFPDRGIHVLADFFSENPQFNVLLPVGRLRGGAIFQILSEPSVVNPPFTGLARSDQIRRSCAEK
jgi:hypothetical protein